VSALRVFVLGGVFSYRALFNWLHPAVFVPTMLANPVLQIVFFTVLGRALNVADDRYFVVGNAIQAAAIAGVFGMVMALANEREFGTLPAILASPANRLALFGGRALPVAATALFTSAFGFGLGWLLLDVPVAASALPLLAGIAALTALSCTMFGLALGSVGLRFRDLWVGSNLAYSLMLLLCGGTVPPAALPGWLAALGQGLPLTHGMAAARRLAAGARPHDVLGLVGGEAGIGLAYGVAGYLLLRLFERQSRQRAALDSL
jgi:ABC-2 type transport system permease protein